MNDRAAALNIGGEYRRPADFVRRRNGFLDKATTMATDERAQLAAPTAHPLDVQPQSMLAPPLSIADLCAMDDPADDFLIEGVVPMLGNLLIAAYPKSAKTWLLLLMAISIATGTPFLGRFTVPQRRKVGLILMEDRDHRIRRRLRRLLLGLGLTMDDIDGWLYLWFRPRHFKLNSPAIMYELNGYVQDFELSALGIDNWVNVAKGNANQSEDVMPQLDAFRDACAPNCTPILVHHAKKTGADNTDDLRLADIIRNSGDFSGWYDAGIVLSRKNETAPVKFRMEMRDDPAPEPFAFTLADE
ncbi:MAG: AAA family ATPase, partial [Gemmatimonadota bacterium]